LSSQEEQNIKFKVPSDVAKIMKQWGGHSVKLAAARGSLPMSGPNLVTVLFIFYHGEDQQLKAEALNTLKELTPSILSSVCGQPDIHPEILDLLARLHFDNMAVMEPLLTNRMVGLKTLMFVAEQASGNVLDLLASNDTVIRKAKALRLAIINNPNADKVLKLRLGWREIVEKAAPEKTAKSVNKESGTAENEQLSSGVLLDESEDDSLSKYQALLTMDVSEKIKMALTGDKEWRTLLVRESNKLVSAAVLRNPRINEAEALMVAKNRASSEELIRIILLNREWLKNYDMKKALIEHPRTPLQNSMRLMTFLTDKDIKELAKSRNVSQAIVNNARRMMMTKKH
jgi:hypothetical protein